jgi:hypothetical protein
MKMIMSKIKIWSLLRMNCKVDCFVADIKSISPWDELRHVEQAEKKR